MPISNAFRNNARHQLKKSLPKRHPLPKTTDADLYWQAVCDLGAYLRLKLIGHFNSGIEGNVSNQTFEFPKVCVTLGSGLDAFGESLTDVMVIRYKDLPGLEYLHLGSVPGHKKCIIAGRLENGTPVVALSGRIHTYEVNGNVDESAFLTAAMLDAGVNDVILTNAAGSLDIANPPGSIMLGTSIAKETVPNFGSGLQHEYAGALFYPAHCVCTTYHDFIEQCAAELGVHTFRGTYVQVPGRRYEFPGEIARLANERQQMLQGNHPEYAVGAVGMSTGHEVEAVCQHATRPEFTGPNAKPLPRAVILSVMTNLGAGLSTTPPNHQEVEAEGKKLAPKFVKILQKLCLLMSNQLDGATTDQAPLPKLRDVRSVE